MTMLAGHEISLGPSVFWNTDGVTSNATTSGNSCAQANTTPSADWQPRVPDWQYQAGAHIYAGGLGVSAVAMLGRAADRRAQTVVTAGSRDGGRA